MFGTISTSARPGDRRCDMLDPRRLGIDRGVEVERPIDDTADDLAAIRHLREDGPIERGGHFRAHHLHRRQHGNFRQVDAERAGEADRVLADVALLIGIGRDIQRDVAEDEAARIGRHRHHRAVADQPSGA